jgi:pectinesterase
MNRPSRRTLRFWAGLALGALAPAVPALAAPVPLPCRPDLIVAVDGSGDFRTIQAAVESITADNRERRIILVRDGVYAEKIRVVAPCLTLRGESRTGTRIEFAQGADEFHRQEDPLGIGVVNLAPTASDFVLENLTVKNTHGVIGPHAFAVFGLADRTVIIDCDILSQGADTLSLWRGRTANTPEVAGSPGPGDGGRYYHARLNVCGSVDFICPRGWCYMTDSTITQVNPGATAAIWHDGSKNRDMKFVLRGCRFGGPPGWILSRHHADAQFYLVDCTFSTAMRDKPPYRVIYPLNGAAPSEADRKRNRELDAINLWGERFYYANAHRTGGDYPWHRDNLATAPGSPVAAQVTAAWTFAGTWDPERTAGPSIRRVTERDGAIKIEFSENVTVKGRPRLVLATGGSAGYLSGSGSNTLVFTAPAGSRATGFDLQGGAIVATEAAATLRTANLALPPP